MDPTQLTWTNLCLSLLERTRDTIGKAPRYFVACGLVFYLPVIAFALLDPIADAWIATSVWAGLVAVAIVFINATAWHGVQALEEEETPTFQTLGAWIKPLLSSLLMTAGIAFAAEFVGALLILPGLVVIVWVTFSGPITCAEGVKGWPAIDKARRFVDDYRWTQVVGALFVIYFGRAFVGLATRLIIRATLMVASEVPSFVIWLNKLIFASFDVVAMSALGVWACIAYRDITELLRSMPAQEKVTASGTAGAGLGLKLPTQLPSLSGFTPPPQVVALMRRGGELLAIVVVGLCAWWVLKPHPVFEAPPPELQLSEVKVVERPTLHLEGRITNAAGRTAAKAVWVVKIPPGIKGVPPAIVVLNFKNGDVRNFSVPLPVSLGEPEILPFRVDWSD